MKTLTRIFENRKKYILEFEICLIFFKQKKREIKYLSVFDK